MRRILIAGTGSGCGKTTITCAILSALKNRGVPLRSFKCGPDYIDPMFHRSVSGIPAWNLDPYFLDPSALRAHLAAHILPETSPAEAMTASGTEERASPPPEGLAVIEGVMGYYDGIAMTSEASTFSVAEATETPAVLALDVSGMGNSVAAIIEGFIRHKESSGINKPAASVEPKFPKFRSHGIINPSTRIGGVIFNNCASGMYPYYRDLAEGAGVRALGYLPRGKDWSVGSRRLGLIPAAEISGLREKLIILGKQAEESIDLSGLMDLASGGPLDAAPRFPPSDTHPPKGPRLAVARDEAFCFIYEENLEILRALGCEPVFFSPLKDTALPENISGLYLPGGYPDVYAAKLSENTALLREIRERIGAGLPAIAEGGGFVYLHQSLDGLPLAGVIPGEAKRTEKLARFGYAEITAKKDNLLCPAGARIRVHEFHYWESPSGGDDFSAAKANGRGEYSCVNASPALYAGFPYLYFPANPAFAKNFVEKMKKYRGT